MNERPESKRAYDRAYYQRPEVRARKLAAARERERIRERTDADRAYDRAYAQRPEVRERRRVAAEKRRKIEVAAAAVRAERAATNAKRTAPLRAHPPSTFVASVAKRITPTAARVNAELRRERIAAYAQAIAIQSESCAAYVTRRGWRVRCMFGAGHDSACVFRETVAR